MTGLLIGAAMVMAVAQTDTTFDAGGARYFRLDSEGGEIRVEAWDRDEVRLQADHGRRTTIEVRQDEDEIEVDSSGRGMLGGIVDYVITLPRSMNVALEGMFSDITVEGMQGEVSAETLQGDIVIRGGNGRIDASSMTGRIRIEGASGMIEFESVAEDVRLVDVSGEIVGESVGGAIVIENAEATSVDVGSVGGRIDFSGPLTDGGTYFFGTHSGTINIDVPAGTGAEFSLASQHGSISADLPGAPERFERRRRTNFSVGGGGAIVEAETFGGRIVVREAGSGEPDV